MIRRPPRSTLFPYTDALPICIPPGTLRGVIARSGHLGGMARSGHARGPERRRAAGAAPRVRGGRSATATRRSEEHTSELQSRQYLVCRLLLEKKKNI